ncbi:cation:proton antiporter [Brevibacterium casei]|nr:cation:proton antiporter [Brevibacterium casei]
MLVLIALMFLSALLDLDVVLGAFMAGMLVKRIAPAEAVERLEVGLQTLGFSFFIPVFFVYSGMGIALAAVAEQPLTLLWFFTAILLCSEVCRSCSVSASSASPPASAVSGSRRRWASTGPRDCRSSSP